MVNAPKMPKALRDRWVYDDLPIKFEGADKITTPTGWEETELPCPDCRNTLIYMSGLYICLKCYICRVQAHSGRTLLLRAILRSKGENI